MKLFYLYMIRLKKVPEEFDSLFIPAFEVSNEVVENRLIDEIIKIIPLLDFVICTARVTDTNRKKLEEACSNADPTCVFKDLTKHDGPEAYALVAPSEKYPSLHMPNVPMVVVAGCWEKTDKFEVSLALRERFIENGYRLLQIGSRDGCEMLGFHSFPGFMLRRDVDATDKIFYFNRWILKRVKEEQPDLILLTIPGATQDFNEQFTRGSGLLHHQVFQAITPDVLLLCTFYMPDSLKILEDLALSCKYRFGASVDAFHMSNLFC